MRALPLLFALGCETPQLGSTAEDDTGSATAPHAQPAVTGEPTPCDEPLDVSLGTGMWQYVELLDGDSVRVRNNPFGYWYVAIAGAVHGAQPFVMVDYTIRRFDGTVVSDDWEFQGASLDDYDPEPCSGWFASVQGALWTNTAQTCALAGEPLEITVQVMDPVTGATTFDAGYGYAVIDPAYADLCD